MAHCVLRLRSIEGSTGAVFPQEVLDDLGVTSGDTLRLVRTSRGYELLPCDAEFQEAMSAFETIRRTHRNAFGELARGDKE